METSDEVLQLTTSRMDMGKFNLPDGRTVAFVVLNLAGLQAGKPVTLHPVTMSPDQARTLAMGLLAAADKAPHQPTAGPVN